jgi:hypothetical protein
VMWNWGSCFPMTSSKWSCEKTAPRSDRVQVPSRREAGANLRFPSSTFLLPGTGKCPRSPSAACSLPPKENSTQDTYFSYNSAHGIRR